MMDNWTFHGTAFTAQIIMILMHKQVRRIRGLIDDFWKVTFRLLDPVKSRGLA